MIFKEKYSCYILSPDHISLFGCLYFEKYWEISALQLFVKAFVRYFYQIFIFSPNDSPSKTMKKCLFHLESSFCSGDIQVFVFLFFPLFLPVSHSFGGWLRTNLKVHDVINYLHKNSITHFVWDLEKEKRYDIETLSIDGVSDKKHSYRKIMQKMCSKS